MVEHKDYRESPGADMQEARGQGQDVNGPKQGDGGAAICKCSSCGKTVPHNRGVPCNQMKCSSCGGAMIGV